MDGYSALNAEITSIRSFALLNLLELDCADLNKEMSNRCLSLRNSLILWQVRDSSLYGIVLIVTIRCLLPPCCQTYDLFLMEIAGIELCTFQL